MMYWNGDWNGWAWFAMTLSMVVFWTVVGVSIWLLVRQSRTSVPPASPSAEEILRRRYAAGELNDEEYTRRLRALRDHATL
jgi:putative membrane protein